jgi:hypothetical protein
MPCLKYNYAYSFLSAFAIYILFPNNFSHSYNIYFLYSNSSCFLLHKICNNSFWLLNKCHMLSSAFWNSNKSSCKAVRTGKLHELPRLVLWLYLLSTTWGACYSLFISFFTYGTGWFFNKHKCSLWKVREIIHEVYWSMDCYYVVTTLWVSEWPMLWVSIIW